MSATQILNHPIVRAETDKLNKKIQDLEFQVKEYKKLVHMHANKKYQLEDTKCLTE